MTPVGVRQGLGRTGERLAVEHLIQRGYHILTQNFRCRLGEIDIVAEHEQDLVFVEVKTRRGIAYGLPEEAVTARKLRTILNIATFYIDRYYCEEISWRIDIVAVQLSTGGRLEEIRIYQHVSIE
jgi:putative endonuclease